mgnify:CR=1 FL=1
MTVRGSQLAYQWQVYGMNIDGATEATYTIAETQPPGYLDGPETAGTAGGDVSVDDRISSIETVPPFGMA